MSRRVVKVSDQFGPRVKSELALRRWTVQGLAEQAGVDRRHMSGVLGGKLNPSLLLVNALRLLLGPATVAWALGESPDRPAGGPPCTPAS